jgi:hypothetical protein
MLYVQAKRKGYPMAITQIAQIWYDDPDGEYAIVVAKADELFAAGTISGYECGLMKRTAAECRDRGKGHR